MYYFITYQWKGKSGTTGIENTITVEHPMKWLYNKLENENLNIVITFYSEVMEEHKELLQEWI